MQLHRELFKNLPPAETLRKQFANAFEQEKNADGFYILAQYIAEQYGDRAYELAEQVFQEMGLTYDPADLRTPDLVRRVGYNLDGINIYHVLTQPFQPEMDKEIVRLYNQQLRLLGQAALLDVVYFNERIPDKNKGLILAVNEARQLVGFCHCWTDGAQGSVEALVYAHGRIYDPVRKTLVQAARGYFAGQGVKQVAVLQGKLPYPFYQATTGPLLASFEQHLSHIAQGLRGIAA